MSLRSSDSQFWLHHWDRNVTRRPYSFTDLRSAFSLRLSRPVSITPCNCVTHKLALDQLHELCPHRLRRPMSDLFVILVSGGLPRRISAITLTSTGHQHLQHPLYCTFSYCTVCAGADKYLHCHIATTETYLSCNHHFYI